MTLPIHRRPLIGLTSQSERTPAEISLLRRAYIQAVVQAGGMPVILPILAEGDYSEWVDSLDALILTGGEDINPLFYQQPPHQALGGVDTKRDECEIGLTRQWLATRKPLLGICRGIQMLQVTAGGTLIQDIPSRYPTAYRHSQKAPTSDPAHEVEIVPDSTLSELLQTSGNIQVNTCHHQAVDGPAPGFRVSSKSADGIIESIEAEDGRLVLGVQWHPEEMDCPLQRRLFENFIKRVKTGLTPDSPTSSQ